MGSVQTSTYDPERCPCCVARNSATRAAVIWLAVSCVNVNSAPWPECSRQSSHRARQTSTCQTTETGRQRARCTGLEMELETSSGADRTDSCQIGLVPRNVKTHRAGRCRVAGHLRRRAINDREGRKALQRRGCGCDRRLARERCHELKDVDIAGPAEHSALGAQPESDSSIGIAEPRSRPRPLPLSSLSANRKPPVLAPTTHLDKVKRIRLHANRE